MKTAGKTVTINSHHIDMAKAYAELAGMSLKASLEYAIERTLVPELEEYINHYPNEEFDKLISRANALLPSGWAITAMQMRVRTDANKYEPMIGFSVGLDLMPTFMTVDQVRVLCTNLEAIAEHGGRVVYGRYDQLGEAIQVRRHGNGLVFERIADLEDDRRATVSIAASSVELIVRALEAGVAAALAEVKEAQ